MARKLCQQCEKPINVCLCSFITDIHNHVKLVILQHPNEVNQSKGTVPLLSHALSDCKVIVGDDFSNNDEVNQLIEHYQQHCVLLYPQDKAITASEYIDNIIANKTLNTKGKHSDDLDVNIDVNAEDILQHICLFVLDGTWKKTYRMFMQSTNLHSLTQLTLPENIEGQYHIRKTKKAHALSTLEACYYCLSALEQKPAKYLPLIENFKRFNQFQLSFRPTEHIKT